MVCKRRWILWYFRPLVMLKCLLVLNFLRLSPLYLSLKFSNHSLQVFQERRRVPNQAIVCYISCNTCEKLGVINNLEKLWCIVLSAGKWGSKLYLWQSNRYRKNTVEVWWQVLFTVGSLNRGAIVRMVDKKVSCNICCEVSM